MTKVMERVEEYTRVATPGTFELEVTIGKTAEVGFLLDPAGSGSGAEHFRRARSRLPQYFDWLEVESEPVLSLVDELVPREPELLPPLPFGILVAPRWARRHRSVEVFVNTDFRKHNAMLVRVPAWAKALLREQAAERWIAMQPDLSRVGKVGLVGIETASTGRRALDVFVRADDLRADDLKRLAAVAGASSGQLLHMWRSLSLAGGGGDPRGGGPTLLSLRLSGKETLDVGVTFPAWRAGSSAEIEKRIEVLSAIYDLDAGRYRESLHEMRRTTGKTPEHTMLGFASRDGDVVLTASFESTTAPHAVAQAS